MRKTALELKEFEERLQAYPQAQKEEKQEIMMYALQFFSGAIVKNALVSTPTLMIHGTGADENIYADSDLVSEGKCLVCEAVDRYFQKERPCPASAYINIYLAKRLRTYKAKQNFNLSVTDHALVVSRKIAEGKPVNWRAYQNVSRAYRSNPVSFAESSYARYATEDAILDRLSSERLDFEIDANLTEKERFVFRERVLNRRTYRSLGNELGLSCSGAENIYNRAVAKLRKIELE